MCFLDLLLAHLQPTPSESSLLFVEHRRVPVYQMHHHEAGEGGRSDRLLRQISACACDVGFSLGAPLSGWACLTALKWHADKNPCNYRTGEVFSNRRCTWSYCWTLGWKGIFWVNFNTFNSSKSRQGY